LVTKASRSLKPPAVKVVRKAPGVTGKFVESVSPVT
jgi:hypothetical protein